MKMKRKTAVSKKKRESNNKKKEESPKVQAKMMTLKFALIICFALLKFFKQKETD